MIIQVNLLLACNGGWRHQFIALIHIGFDIQSYIVGLYLVRSLTIFLYVYTSA